MAFEGYLIYLGENNIPFPNDYILKESFHISPGRRQDINSGLNNKYVLRRNVAKHTRTTIEFSAIEVNNIELVKMCKLFRDNYIDELERKIYVSYYVPAKDDYMQGEFYFADPEYVIKQIDEKNKEIKYATVKFSLIEY